MKKTTLLFMAFLVCYVYGFAQITLTQSDMPAIGESQAVSNALITSGLNVGPSGANQTWDFAGLVPIDTFTSNFVAPAGTPGAASFPTATLAIESEDSYSYAEVSSSAAILLGVTADTSGMGDYFDLALNPTSTFLQFPTTYNTAWTDDSGFVLVSDESGPGFDSIRLISNSMNDVWFDGYGTVITPLGSFECLRERNINTTTSISQFYSFGAWITLNTTTIVDTSYNWYSQNSKGALVSMDIMNGSVSGVNFQILESVSIAPVAAFSSVNQGAGQISFTDQSSNSPTSWSWDFGDGNTSTQQNPSHAYAATGTYTVCLTVTNSAGSDMTCQTVDATVVVAPIAAYTSSDLSLGMIQFMDQSTNSPTSWLWDFGDGNTSTQQNPTHTYAATGTYTVCLTVTNSAGSDMTCLTVDATVVVAPIAAYTSNDLSLGMIQFMDQSTNSPTSWLWDFGDGNTSTQQNPTHTYATTGTYTVCLTVTNSAGSDMICQTVSVDLTQVPIAAFSFTDLGQGSVDFSDDSTNDPTSWSWDFGDTNTSNEQNPSHTYSVSGTYNVCLTVTNSAGSNMTCMDVSVVVVQVPAAAFSYMDIGQGSLDFTDASTNGPTSWLWDFGDGNTSSDQNPSHSYSVSGMYTVCLTATNIAGSDMTCQTLDVTITSTDDLSKSVHIELFPNPASERVTIQLESFDQQMLSLKVYNAIGQSLVERKVNSTGSYFIQVKKWPAGLYRLVLQTEDGLKIHTRNFITK